MQLLVFHILPKKRGLLFLVLQVMIIFLLPFLCSVVFNAGKKLGSNGHSTGDNIGYVSKMTLSLVSILPICSVSPPETGLKEGWQSALFFSPHTNTALSRLKQISVQAAFKYFAYFANLILPQAHSFITKSLSTPEHSPACRKCHQTADVFQN